MASSSKIIECFKILENKKTETEATDAIIKAIKDTFKLMYEKTMQQDLATINKLLKENYVKPIIEKENSLYNELQIENLLAEHNPQTHDNPFKLAKEFESFQNKTNWKKTHPLEISDNFPQNNKHWFYYHVNKIISKASKEKIHEFICPEIICMIHNITFVDFKAEPWVKAAIHSLKNNTPHIWNSCVYVYFLGRTLNIINLNKKSTSDESQENSETHKTNTVSHIKQIYKRITTLVIINHIHQVLSSKFSPDFSKPKEIELSNESQQNNSQSFHFLTPSLLLSVNSYLLSDSNAGCPIKNWITKNSNIRSSLNQTDSNQTAPTSIIKELFYVCIVTLAHYISNQEQSAKAMKNIDFIPKSRKFEYKMTESFLTPPSEDEVDLMNAIKTAFFIQRTARLHIFDKTEEAIFEKQDSKVSAYVRAINKLQKAEQKENFNHKISEALKDLVSYCDEITVNFSAFKIDYYAKSIPKTQEYIIDCLEAYEKCFLDKKREDIYYINDIIDENYSALKDALKYHSENLNASILDIYENVEKTVKKHYFSDKKENVHSDYTEQDLLNILNQFAWFKVKTKEWDFQTFRQKKELFFEGTPPSYSWYETCKLHDVYTDILKSDPQIFFKDIQILNENTEFSDKNELLACAGKYLAKRGETMHADEVVQHLLETTKELCEEEFAFKKNKKEMHTNYYSKDALTFGATCILSLPYQKKLDVIKKICENLVGKLKSVSERTWEQTLIILLNWLILQPNVRIDHETSKQIFFTIFNRSLLPQQLLNIGNFETHPFLNKLLTQTRKELTTPQVNTDQSFPSPSCMYLHANILGSEEKRKKEFFTINDQKQITLKAEIPKEITDFYKLCCITNGISWRLCNRDFSKNTSIDRSVFEALFEQCTAFWNELKRTNSWTKNDTLKLTWSTQLLLITFSNLIRNGNSFLDHNGWKHSDILQLAVFADYTQKKNSQGYNLFLNTAEEPNTENKNIHNFFMFSGALRYSSILYEINVSQMPSFEFTSPEMIEDYCRFIIKEKNERFFFLTLRFLTLSDFLQKINLENLNSIKAKIETYVITLKNCEDHFLFYDNIEKNQIDKIHQLIVKQIEKMKSRYH